MEISDCSEAKKSKLSSTDDNIEQSNGDLLETTLGTGLLLLHIHLVQFNLITFRILH